ncbi:MAG: hypothetical protein U0U09_18660 [Cyclobacteriaceae bacterium]
MKRGDIIGLIIVVLIIIGVVVWLSTESEDGNRSQAPSDSNSTTRLRFLERLADRCKRIQDEIDIQAQTLQLTTEMQKTADRFVDQLSLAAKIFLAVLTTAILYGFVYNGIGIWTAVLTLAAVIGVVIPVMTFFFFKNVMTLEALINWFFLQIRNVIYKKYGCDAATIQNMRQNIVVKQEVVTILNSEMNRVV